MQMFLHNFWDEVLHPTFSSTVSYEKCRTKYNIIFHINITHYLSLPVYPYECITQRINSKA